MCNKLVLSWQNRSTREWFPVGQLSHEGDKFVFNYTQGALEASNVGFIGLAGLNKFNKKYSSDTIFPVFQNRVFNKSRPDRPEFLEWINIDLSNYSQFEELARTGGIKATDNLQLYPVPTQVDGKYKVNFFTHGVSHLIDTYKARVFNLSEGEELYICSDYQNEYDPNAMFLRTDDPIEIVGYCPKFFVEDFKTLFDASKETFSIKVVKVNPDAPEQLRLLCELSCDWPEGFIPFDRPQFKLINESITS